MSDSGEARPLRTEWMQRVLNGNDPALAAGPSSTLAIALLVAVQLERLLGRECCIRSTSDRSTPVAGAWHARISCQFGQKVLWLDEQGALAVAAAVAATHASRVLSDRVTEAEYGLIDFAALRIADALSTDSLLGGCSIEVAEVPAEPDADCTYAEVRFTLGGRAGCAWISHCENEGCAPLFTEPPFDETHVVTLACRAGTLRLPSEGEMSAANLAVGDVLLLGPANGLQSQRNHLVTSTGWVLAETATRNHTPTSLELSIKEWRVHAPGPVGAGDVGVAVDLGHASQAIDADLTSIRLSLDPGREATVRVPGRMPVAAETVSIGDDWGVRLLETPAPIRGFAATPDAEGRHP